MKKVLFLIALAVPVLLAAQKQVINDKNAEVRKLNGSFHAIKVGYAFNVYLTQGDEEGVVVSAGNDEVRAHIKTEVKDGVLTIGFDEPGKWWKWSNAKSLKAYISFKQLDKINASGATDVIVNGGIKANELEVHLSGASDFKGSITANELVVELSGASDMQLSGSKVTTLKVEANGASDFKGYDLVADNCSANASGASDIKVTVNNELNASASGASGIYYKGQGKIRDLKSSGASSVSRKG